jgi:hypothetical protein
MHPYFASFRTLASVAAGFVVVAASVAEAQPKALFITSEGPECRTLEECPDPGEVCGAAGEVCKATQYSDGSDANVCVVFGTVQYCCETATDCPAPSAGGRPATCVLPRDATFGHGLCSYVDWDPCLAELPLTDAELVRACFEPAMGVGTAPYGIVPLALGDCDGDGIANGAELGCICDPSSECGSGDRDGGMTTPDAGANTMDAGELPPFDSGTGDVDANLPPGTGLDFRGAGGCACEAGDSRAIDARGSAALLLTLGALFAVRTRRRRSNTPAKADPRG